MIDFSSVNLRCCTPGNFVRRNPSTGFTLTELLMSSVVLAVAIVSLLGADVWQLTLTEHARNVSWATNDAIRVMEQLRLQNSGAGCTTPSAVPPVGFATWDAWLGDTTVNGGGGKSIQPNPLTYELVLPRSSGADPIQVTVSVCWRHRNRTLGGCGWSGTQLTDPGGTVQSPVMLSTWVRCRQ